MDIRLEVAESQVEGEFRYSRLGCAASCASM